MESFPYINENEFRTGASAFEACFEKSHNSSGWATVRFVDRDGLALSITKDLPAGIEEHHACLTEPAAEAADDRGFEIEGNDDESVLRELPSKNNVSVDFSIVLSPSYQVPVLYFSFSKLSQGGPYDLDSVYRRLVPAQHKANIKAIGIMGGITSGYHPLSNAPSFFIHPCNTAKTLQEAVGMKTISPSEYVILWIGIVGSCVDLWVPSELAEKILREAK